MDGGNASESENERRETREERRREERRRKEILPQVSHVHGSGYFECIFVFHGRASELPVPVAPFVRVAGRVNLKHRAVRRLETPGEARPTQLLQAARGRRRSSSSRRSHGVVVGDLRKNTERRE